MRKGFPDAVTLAQQRIVIVEGTGTAAAAFGIVAKPETVEVRQIEDTRARTCRSSGRSLRMSPADVPPEFKIFARRVDRSAAARRQADRSRCCLVARHRSRRNRHRTFPYLLQALQDLQASPSAESVNLWAFFDSAYRVRADPDYLAAWWRRAGISVLHAAAWHDVERIPRATNFTAKVIAACHRNAISVYAWLELPHVSEAFWKIIPNGAKRPPPVRTPNSIGASS